MDYHSYLKCAIYIYNYVLYMVEKTTYHFDITKEEIVFYIDK